MMREATPVVPQARRRETAERAEILRFSLDGLSDLGAKKTFTHGFRHSRKLRRCCRKIIFGYNLFVLQNRRAFQEAS